MTLSSTVLLFAASAAIMLVTCQGSVVDPNHQGDFAFLGTINGKVFFAPVNETKMDWFTARGLCQSAGFQLAQFRSSAEFSLVYQNMYLGDYSPLWIGAWAYSASAFTNIDGSDMLNMGLEYSGLHYICVYIHSVGHTYTDFCNTGQHQPLCETV